MSWSRLRKPRRDAAVCQSNHHHLDQHRRGGPHRDGRRRRIVRLGQSRPTGELQPDHRYARNLRLSLQLPLVDDRHLHRHFLTEHDVPAARSGYAVFVVVPVGNSKRSIQLH